MSFRQCTFAAILAVLTLPVGAWAQTVRHHPNPTAPLDERWGWALEAGQRSAGGGVWIGYSFTRPMEESYFVLSTAEFNIFTTDSFSQSEPSLYEHLFGTPPDAHQLSDEEMVRREAERALRRIRQERDGGPKVDKAVGIILGFRPSGRSVEVVDLWVGNLEFAFDFEGRPLHWLGEASDAASLALLDRYYRELPDTRLQARIVNTMGLHVAPDHTIPILGRILESRADTKVREEAAEGLGDQADDRAVPLLSKAALEDPALDVREEAAESLGNVGTPGALEALIRVSRAAADVGVREEAAEALASYADPRAVEALEHLAFEDDSEDVQEEAVESLAEVYDHRGVPAVVNIARNHPNPNVREEAVETLGEVRTPVAIAAVKEVALRDPDLDVQEEAFEVLVDLPDRLGLASVIEAAESHPSRDVRKAAIEALGESKDPQALSALKRLVR